LNANGPGAAFPGVAESADGFAEAHGEFDYGLQPLHIHRGQACAVREQQLGVAQNSGERIIDFVAKNFRYVFRHSRPRGG
jgi:hypothetical protein